MAEDVSVRELPSSERVMTSLKSSGTFDRFRKSCMESIELEPVYLQQAEDLRQSGEDYLSKDGRASYTSKNDMRNELRGHIIKELSKPNVQKSLEDMITEVIKSREDKISEMISDEVDKLTKAEECAKRPSSNPSSSQVAPTHSLSKEAPKETALELLDAFGVSVSDAKKRASKEAVGSGKAKPLISSEPKRGLSGGKQRGVAPHLSQVRPLADVEQNVDDKETGGSKHASRKQHHFRLSSSDDSGTGDGEESDNQPPLGEPLLQPRHTSTKLSREKKELGLALQLQATKKLNKQKVESQYAPAVHPATKPATSDSKDGPDNPRLPVAGSHHLSRHLKRPLSSTEAAPEDGSSVQQQQKRKKYVNEDAVTGEECPAESEHVATGVGGGSSGRAKDNTVIVTRSQLRKSRKN